MLAILIVAGAQQPPRPTAVQGSRPFYLQAGPVLTRDIAGTPNHRVLPALAGYAMGVTAAAGYAYAPSAAVELELAWAGVVSTQQQFSYYWREDYRTENVDRFVNVLGRWTVPGTFISVVGGGGLLWTTLNQRDGVSTVFLPNRPPEKLPLPDQSVRYFALTLTGGVDAEIALSPRLRVVPGGRLRWLNRPVDGASAYAGSGGYVFQLGVGLRAAF